MSQGPNELAVVIRPGMGYRRKTRDKPPADTTGPEKVIASATLSLFVEGLRINASIGHFDHERKTRQDLLFDLLIELAAPVAEDHLKATLDYDYVQEIVANVAGEGHTVLIETLAQRVADRLFDDVRVRRCRITINKPNAARQAAKVGCIIDVRR